MRAFGLVRGSPGGTGITSKQAGRGSATIAAIVSFWPDHLELHGDLARYRAAKETIVRHQRPSDLAIVNADDASAGFAAATRAEARPAEAEATVSAENIHPPDAPNEWNAARRLPTTTRWPTRTDGSDLLGTFTLSTSALLVGVTFTAKLTSHIG